nr:ATP-binding protein [Mesorhizobium xinjiangense]
MSRLTGRQRRAAVAGSEQREGPEQLTALHLAEAVPDPLLLADRTGALLLLNHAARAAFGTLRPGTLLQMRFRSPEMQEMIGRLMAEEPGPHVVEYVERVPIERWFRVVGKPVGEGTGLIVLVFKDQSEVRRIDRMRADFIANASHELRTPLASIAGFIDTIRGPASQDPEARDRFLQIMEAQTARMARLIDDLLSLSRLEMKPYIAPSEPIELGRLVNGVIDALGHLASEMEVAIEKDIPGEPVEIRGNRDELIQVFENLLENACKYGQSGGRVVVRMEVDKGAPAGEVRVAIRDFGPGIAEEHIPRITERFYRVDVETSRSHKGTGLGLAIVKHILTRNNARLSIKSKLGEGATFTVHLPLA